ncbi:hypothetical protein CONLIGDRAFT_162978 [Coniochaeta ligniaria NRRL 30616]|uniref:Actin-like ATPase domain-containing protein n=1 Tax=Coniochaeta ligniaria NRRL 30616 TaxID=1408157 RepID=A0A1J7J0U9_9PEZI|nr:hypothetical protein CONLIGDRAFT_162978 [Coniochaeta ligniaria NRRL 30616]
MASCSVLFLGFDFGTTFSSASYAILDPSSGEPPRIESVRVLGADGSRMHSRVPSTLSADPNAPQWGPYIPPGAQTLRLLKLALPNEDDLPGDPNHSRNLEEVREAMRMIRYTAGMKGVSATAKYLSSFWNACESGIEAAEHVTLKDMDVRVLFTYPASWRHDARFRMRDAVLASGILNAGRSPATMELLPESEAAALAVLPGLAASCHCKVGDLVVICDCGGGTVDVGSYEITSLSPLTVGECVAGESQLCGAIFLEGPFYSLIDHKLAELAEIKRCANINRERTVARIRAEWEQTVKLYFPLSIGPRGQRCQVFLHGDGNMPSGPLLVISSDEVAAVFRSLTTTIIELAKKQVVALLERKGRLPKRIVLVGGFGCNPFLQQEFSDCFDNGMMHFAGDAG